MTMYFKKIIYIISLFMLFTACNKQKVNVGLVVNDQTELATEIKALAQLLDKQADFVSYEVLPLNTLSSLNKYDVVWYHRPDSSAINEAEINAGQTIKEYVSNGGQLILSMEAVRLLNAWGIEQEPVQTKYFEAKDNGFGRKLGFHAYREHPIFDKMFGGAYTWHGKQDNTCRVLGFFEDTKPQTPNVNVIGTLWEYIYYHPKDKILWETPLNKGRVLAIGGCLYFDQENFHAKILEQFVTNSIHYMHGDKTTVKALSWEYEQESVLPLQDKFEKVSLSEPTPWTLPDTQHCLQRKASKYYFDLPSQRSVVVGAENAGIEEVWTHPFMSLRDYRVFLDIQGIDTLVSLSAYTPDFEIRPNAAIRTYQIGNLSFKEIITSKIDKAATIVHYQWEGEGLARIITDYKSNLRFMWPYDEWALGSILYSWSDEANAFIVTDKNKEFYSLVGANVKGEPLLSGRFDNFLYKSDKSIEGVTTDKFQIASSVAYNVSEKKALDVALISGTGLSSMISEYTSAMQAPLDILSSSAAYYQDYLNTKLAITTPDPVFNEGLKWATLSSSQFIVETPGIGTSLMAGYSTSRRGWGGAHKVSGRPGYAWYFGRDAVWSGFAFNGLGDFSTVKKVLETLIRFQQVDGKIYHELTTSGSVHFDASDATPLFVNLMAHYLKSSGDLEFVKTNMPSIHKAMDYCYSTDTDGDHLIEISNVGHGWLEGGKLYGSHTEFYLIGVWNAALRDAAYLSEITHNPAKKEQYSKDAQRINDILNADFWNPKGYYNYGKYKDGSYTDEFISLTTVPVYFNVTDSVKAYQMVKQFASNAFSADWGVRMTDKSNALFSPTAYHFGSIWPLFTGWTALAEYQTGRYNQGFSHIMGNLLNYKHFALGRVPEVINGVVYKPSGVTLHQCWSETMVIQPTIEGMLGYRPDALNNAAELAPRIPFDWSFLNVDNLKMGNQTLNFNLKRENNQSVYRFIADKPIALKFHPAFALGTQITKVTLNGKEVPFSMVAQEEYVSLHTGFEVSGETVLKIEHTSGVSALPSVVEPRVEEASSDFRVLDQSLTDNILTVTVEGRAGTEYPLELYLPDGYEGIAGAGKVNKVRDNVYAASVAFDKVNTVKQIKITIKK